MFQSSLLCCICRSRKCKFVFCVVWIGLSTYLLYGYLYNVLNFPKKPSPFSTLTSVNSSVSSFRDKLENTTEILSEVIKTRNGEQVMRNLDFFGPITNDTIVIVIQTNKRKTYLEALIDSLKNSRYINETVLVISHGSYDDDMNRLVEAISFTRVIQIYFPYSLQTHANSFPGFSPGDCPHGLPQLPKNCFGKARDFKSLQVKHHWWWKINFVFNHLRITRDFQGLVLFLEEDHYVLPDFLHILKLMNKVSSTKCQDCNVFGVGRNPGRRGIHDYRGLSEKVSVQQWNNMGFAFTREFWRGLDQPRCREMFCEYNDYNWDFTLAYLSHKCLPREIKPLTVISPRVFHIGDCGVHFHGTKCDENKSLNEVRDLQRLVAEFLFPPELTVINTDFRQMKVDGHNGGWDDPRDIQLCKNMSRGQHE